MVEPARAPVVLDVVESAIGDLTNYCGQLAELEKKMKNNSGAMIRQTVLTTRDDGTKVREERDMPIMFAKMQLSCLIENSHYRLESISNHFKQNGDHKASISQMERCIQIIMNSIGPNHMLVAEARYFMGEAMQSSGDHHGAIQQMDIVLRILQGGSLPTGEGGVGTAKHPFVGYAHSLKSKAWSSLQEHGKAEREIRMAIAIMKKSPAFRNDPNMQRIDDVLGRTGTGKIARKAASHSAQRANNKRIPTANKKSPRLGVAGHPEYLGVSVHYLKSTFLKEVEHAGLSRDACIYEIENLQGPPGLVRKKGQDLVCPISHKKGAAYVHCLEGDDNVGPSTHMLSYTWGYRIGDIIDTLDAYCKEENLNPKRTYFWICFLCVNQHRVVETSSSESLSVPTDTFLATFGERVARIGRIVCMMSPWEQPLYLNRIWCVYEMATAFASEQCTVTIRMPPTEKERLTLFLATSEDCALIDTLFDVLNATNVETAKASQEEDRKKILEIIKKQNGGYHSTNSRVNQCLRAWVHAVIFDLLSSCEALSSVSTEKTSEERISISNMLYKLAMVFESHGDLELSLLASQEAARIQEGELGQNHPITIQTYILGVSNEAKCHSNIGTIFLDTAKYDQALVCFRKAQLILEKELGPDSIDVAGVIQNVASCLHAKGDYLAALERFRSVLQTQESFLGANHPDVARTHNNIGTVLDSMKDHDGALTEYARALAIRQKVLGPNHPEIAPVYYDIGRVLARKGDADAAIESYQKALCIHERVLGTNHPTVALIYHSLAKVHQTQKDYAGAKLTLEKCLRIQNKILGIDKDNLAVCSLTVPFLEKTFGSKCPSVVATFTDLSFVLCEQGAYSEALLAMCTCKTLQYKFLGPNHLSKAGTHQNIAKILIDGMDNKQGALKELTKSLSIRQAVLGRDHPETIETRDLVQRLQQEIISDIHKKSCLGRLCSMLFPATSTSGGGSDNRDGVELNSLLAPRSTTARPPFKEETERSLV